MTHPAFLLAFLMANVQADEPWAQMDYGPFLSAAIEVTPDNIACKGIAIPLDEDGEHAMLFDTAELRWAAAWEGEFVELRGIVYDGPHGIWPRIAGEPAWTNATGPGVYEGIDGFRDPRAVPYGPLPNTKWHGLVRGEDGVTLHYSVGSALIWERADLVETDEAIGWRRTLEVTNVGEPVTIALADVPAVSQIAIEPDRVVVASGGRRMFIDIRGTSQGAPTIENKRIALKLMNDGINEIVISYDEIDLASVPESGGLAAAYAEAGPALWPERLQLAGELEVSFGPDDGARSIVRTPGDRPADLPLRGGRGAIPRMTDINGVMVADRARPAGDALVVFMPAEVDLPEPLAAWACDESSGAAMPNAVDGERDLRLDGATWRRGVRGRSLDFDGTAHATWTRADDLEFLDTPLTITAWIHTTKDGTIVAQTNEEGPWIPGGKTFFVRNGAVCFDIGWVGVVCGETVVADGHWHHVGFSWDPETSEIVLWVDGSVDGRGTLEPEEPLQDAIVRFGFTNDNFPGESRFSGYMDGLRIDKRVLDEREIAAVAASMGEPLVRAYGVRGEIAARFQVRRDRARLAFEPTATASRGALFEWRGPESGLARFGTSLARSVAAAPFAIDRVTWPIDNPWYSWMRFGDFDFLDDGRAAAISTWNGDVWRVDGLDADLDRLAWQRIASGLSQPLGLLTRGDEILVVGRDQVTRLVDLDGDRETDRYEAFNADAMNSPHFHEPASGFVEGPDGSLYYIKAARHAKLPIHPRHGTLVRVDADGATSSIVAGGFRAPNGVFVDDDGVAWGSDQEGHWMPANRINRITPGSFHGNNWSGTQLGAKEARTTYEPPLCWIHPTVDRSPAAQLRVPDGVWGDLAGKLLGVSYGTGEVYLILEDEVDGAHQGGVVPLPIMTPTGTMRGRFHPDGSLYVSGLFGWSSDRTDPGGFYRVRRTTSPLAIPTSVRAVEGGLLVTFNQRITTPSSQLASAFDLEAWNYRWSADYGSPRLRLDGAGAGVTALEITGATCSDGHTVRLEIPEMQPAMQMHLEWALDFAEMGPVSSFVHFTVHRLAER